MTFEILTLFPRLVEGPLQESVLGKAIAKGLVSVRIRDIRDHAHDKHHVTDDTPYGGGAGMVMKADPLVEAIEAARESAGGPCRVVLLDPGGRRFDQEIARELREAERVVLVCGRYEGVDERVRAYVDDELSVGDFVLTGGELAALCVVDACSRLVPGVLGNEQSALSESFQGGILEHPQYTRPPVFRGAEVPEVLLSGDHARVARWRRKQALLRTRERRPDLFSRLDLTEEDRELLENA